ncbi:RNA degradosome polyphosphate kinase, partial [Oceanobacter sp. 2_MG-2023]|nr:RNA degradosome polyphosphate kinase [Oceanobacter sp. 2_MG-2023]
MLHKLNLAANDLYMVNGPVTLGRMMEVIGQINRPDLQSTPFTPGLPKNIKFKKSIFECMRERAKMLLHPFESFT